MSNSSFELLVGGPNGPAPLFDRISEINQFLHDLNILEGGLGEDQFDRYGEVQIVLKSPLSCSCVHGAECRDEYIISLACESYRTRAGKSLANLGKRKANDCGIECNCPTCENEELVFVTNIQGVDFVDTVLPVRMRLRLFNLDRDVFGSPLYMSTTQHRLFVLKSVDRELDILFASDQRLHDGPINVVKGGAEAMDSVAQNKRNISWDGYLGFDGQGQLASAWIKASDDFERIFLEIFGNFPVKVVDVLTRSG